MTKTMRLMALGLSVVVFTGCSAVEDLVNEYADDQEEEYQGYQDDGNTNSGGNNYPETVTGVFQDANVAGLNYACSSGKTDLTTGEGEYTCNVGDRVEFSLGGYVLGSVTATSGIVTPMALYPDNPEAATNVLQLLQTLDSGEDGTITIPENFSELDDVTTGPTDSAFDDVMEAELDKPLVSEDDAQAHMLKTLLAGKTLYTGVWGEMATFESMSFSSDLKSSSWQEIVDVDDRLDNGNGTLTIDGMIITYTCTYDSGYDNPSECSNEEPFIMTVTEILEDYMLVLSKDEEGEESVNRVYYDEEKARAYLLAGSSTVDLTALNAPAEVAKNIIGTWSKGCRGEGVGSESDTFTFAADGTGYGRGAYYHTPGCNPGDEADQWDNTFTYVIGESTTGANGEAAVEIDQVILENGKTITYYDMFHFTAVNKFIKGDDGSDDESNTPETRDNVFLGRDEFILTGFVSDADLNTPAEVTKNIVGIWDEGCTEYDGGSETSLVVFNDDNRGTFNGGWYPSPDCSGDAEDSWSGTFTYTIGEATKGSAGEDALKVNMEITEDGDTEGYYTMAHFYTVNEMGLAHNDDNDEENTPETRHNIFGVNNVMVRK